MVVTQLEGKVLPEKWDALKQAYHAEMLEPLPPFIYQTFLVQSDTDRNTWRILTFWKSRQDLMDYRASVDTPSGVLMFRAADSEPNLSIFEVIDRSSVD